MRNIPLALRQAKNAFGQDSPWLPLVVITLPAPDNTVFRIVPNTEDITFQGNTFYAFPVQIDLPKETSKGEIPFVNITVSNVTRVIQGQIESLNGGIGATVQIIIVNTGHLTEDYAELTLDLEVQGTDCTPQWITFKCGPPNPMKRRFPLYRYMAASCGWSYKSVECGYSGALTTCKRTLADCQTHNNSTRFGGFPGLDAGGLRLA